MTVSRKTLGYMFTNCYFLTDDASRETIIVDPAAQAQKILDELRQQNLKPVMIVLTHAHFDHMMALKELLDALRIPFCLHKMDAPALSDPVLNLSRELLHRDLLCPPPDRLLEEGDVLCAGESRLTVLHTPGHTPGSICLLGEDALISGDTLFRQGMGRTDFPGGDIVAMRSSLHRLASLDGGLRVFPGHGEETTIADERLRNPYLAKQSVQE